MFLDLSASDVVILSCAAACLVAIVLLEMLRFVVPDIYEWLADHAKVKREIKDAQVMLEKLLARNRDNAALRDRRSAERFRMKSHLARVQMMLSAVERDRVEVWHELGQQGVADGLFTAQLSNRILADQSQRDFDSAPIIWRYSNTVRIWASSERMARQMLNTEFPNESGYLVQDVTFISSGSAGNRS